MCTFKNLENNLKRQVATMLKAKKFKFQWVLNDLQLILEFCLLPEELFFGFKHLFYLFFLVGCSIYFCSQSFFHEQLWHMYLKNNISRVTHNIYTFIKINNNSTLKLRLEGINLNLIATKLTLSQQRSLCIYNSLYISISLFMIKPKTDLAS